MFKDLIVYSSKNGTTTETVRKIKAAVKKNVDVCDLSEKSTVDLSQYDRVFIGSGIYASNLQSKVAKFVKGNSAALKSKKVIFFIHGILSEKNYTTVIENSLKGCIGSSYESCYLGGKLDYDKQNFFVKKLMQVVSKEANLDPKNANTLNEKKLADLIEKISL